MVDGIDGSGKHTIVEAMGEQLQSQGHTSFDIGEWSKVHHELPSAELMKDADVIIGVEPSYVWTGAAIRYELVRADKTYSARAIACAFSLDRLVLYKRCYLPALERGTTIIAERGVSSSLVYQPASDETLSVEELLTLPGNTLAMQHAPDHLVIATLDPQIAMQRLGKRSNKQDDHVFEQEAFLKTLHERYHSAWLQKCFTDRGTKIHFLDTHKSIDAVCIEAKKLCSSLLEKS